MSESVKDLDKLLPDYQSSESPWNDDVSRAITHLLARPEFNVKHRSHMRPEYLKHRVHGMILRAVNEYHTKHSTWPTERMILQDVGKQLSDMQDASAISPGEAALAYHEAEQVLSIDVCIDDIPGIEAEIISYCKHEAMKHALNDGFKILASNKDDKYKVIEDRIVLAADIGASEENIVDYCTVYKSHIIGINDGISSAKRTVIGFNTVEEELEGGLLPGELGLFIGDSGTGKSQVLVHAAIVNAMRGNKTYFVSVENLMNQTLERFHSRISGMSKRMLRQHPESAIERIEEMVRTIWDNLKIACYPMGTVSVAEIAADLQRYTMRTGWKTDSVALDYLDEIREYPAMSTYDSQGLIIRDFRRWLQQIQAGGLTATQTNRGGSTAGVVRRDNTGDSYWKIRRSDAVWTLNCDRNDEHPRGVMRIYVDKHRNGKDNFFVYCKRDFTRCWFEEITSQEYEQIMKAPPIVTM